MHFCYLDEAGSAEPPDLGYNATPVMVILGLIVDAVETPAMTSNFLALKRQFFPGRFRTGPALDHVLVEVKGNELLQMTRSASRDKRRHAARFREALLSLISQHGCRLTGRIWVKEVGIGLDPAATYCYSVQDIAGHFSTFLSGRRSNGLIVADSRNPASNINVAHSIFTQKWQIGGDPYPNLSEVPLFAHSDNHVGLQVADLIASAIVFPMAASAYGAPQVSIHACSKYHELRTLHGEALRGLQFRYQGPSRSWRGGLVVSDPVGKQSGARLFRPPRVA